MKLASVVGISGGIVGGSSNLVFPPSWQGAIVIKVPKIVEFLGGSLENQIANNKKQVWNLWALDIFSAWKFYDFVVSTQYYILGW